MPTFQREDTDNLQFTLSVTLTPADYESDFEAELAKYRKQASLKGFRKGKTPASVVRKMFGKSVLAEVLNKQLHKSLEDYLRDNQLNILGGPLPLDDDNITDLSVRELEEYTFHYKMGLEPEFEIKGIGPETEYVRFEVQISETTLDEELERLREGNPRVTELESDFRESDTISFKVAELKGDVLKEDGWESTFDATPSQIKDEALRAQVLAAKKGDTLRLNMFTAFDVEESTLYDKWLGIDREDPTNFVNEMFEARIEKVTRTEPATFDEQFFHDFFGEDVNTAAQAKDIIRKEIEASYAETADSMLYSAIRKHIPEVTEVPLPKEFLWEWLTHTKDDDTDEADLESGFEGFIEGLQWSLIRNKLVKAFDIQVSEEQILERFKNRIKSYFGNSPYFQDDFITSMAARLMEKEDEVQKVFDELLTESVFKAVASQAAITNKPVSKEDFEAEMDALRKALQGPEPDEPEETDEPEDAEAGPPASESEE
ncbi:MAG: hypothetical protein KF852_13160 [Saprospiraceae bacterium]|nr:hypothetical protein [Saprospiraceae bacterium]